MKPMCFNWTYSVFGTMETESHGYIQILWTVYENGKWVSVVKEGEKFFDIIENMHFGVPQKSRNFETCQ